ncbi:MAG: PAS domain-containing sensor histidine kinase [Magnetovibrionaceae bacterium]
MDQHLAHPVCEFDGDPAIGRAIEGLPDSVLRGVLLHANDIVLITKAGTLDDPGPEIVFVNKAFCTVTGYRPNEVIGKTPRILQGPKTDPETTRIVRGALEAGKPVRVEVLNYTKTGKEYWLDMNILPLANANGEIEYFAAIQRDITEERQAREALTRSQAALEPPNSSKDRFFSILAHDLRSPFSVIMGFAQVLNRRAEQLTPAQVSERSRDILNASNRLYDLLENLLHWARKQMGALSPCLDVASLSAVLETALRPLQPTADNKGVTLESQIGNRFVRVDAGLLSTVFRNLIANAVKFSQPGQTVRITAEDKGDFTVVSVADEGVGISPDMQADLFTLDRMTRSLGTEGEKGTGLGLPLCRDLIEAQGGEIWVESEPDKGTRISFTIPRA